MSSPNFSRTLKLLKPFVEETKPYIGQQLVGETYHAVMSLVCSNLYPKAERDQLWALQRVCRRMEGSTLTKERLLSLGAYVLHKLPVLAEGIVPSLWDGKPTKADMLCIGVQQLPGQPKLMVHTFCLRGEAAGLFFAIPLSRALLEYILSKNLGLTARKYKAEAEEIAGCYFQCIVNEDTSRAYFTAYGASQKMKDLNKALAERRADPRKCSTPMLPCSRCVKTRDICNKAVWKGN